MSELKCPFCQQELEEETFYRGRVFVSCNNPNCIISDWGGCSKQIITELIRTRKALQSIYDYTKIVSSELAKNHLGQFQKPISKIGDMAHIALKAEQKDVK